MAKRAPALDSILDLNNNNVWSTDATTIAKLWEEDKTDEDFASSEDKLLNIIRLAYEVNHYNPNNPREKERFENGEWAIFSHVKAERGNVAIRPKEIKRITDLSYENINHVTAPLLLELIDRNFGGGWDSISLAIRDIIETGFDISTTTLPTSRLHSAGGTYEQKTQDGYEVLEIQKGNWTEAIFAKKKEPVIKPKYETTARYDEDGNLITEPVTEEDEEIENETFGDDKLNEDETYYSSYSDEAKTQDEDEEEELGGLNVE